MWAGHWRMACIGSIYDAARRRLHETAHAWSEEGVQQRMWARHTGTWLAAGRPSRACGLWVPDIDEGLTTGLQQKRHTVHTLCLHDTPPAYLFNSPRWPKHLFYEATVWFVIPNFLSRAYSKPRAEHMYACVITRGIQRRSRRAIWLRFEKAGSRGVPTVGQEDLI